ncbi:MAG TPA: efflux RND transporter periplasmic adaptor subunit [Candidatus Binataceae bacterium]|nr:efflux RND transporter periplasmic adaptor subunit [Candidatus Binataceae bacterium]
MSEVQSTLVSDRPGGHRLRWALAFSVLIVIALVMWHFFTGAPPRKGAGPQTVKVAQAVLGQMPVVLDELGTVTPTATITVVPNQAVSGYLIKVPFEEGQDIQKGQLLAQIDPRPYEVQKQQAEAQLAKDQSSLNQARSDLARYARLEKQKSIAEQTYVDQLFLVQQDAAAVKMDEANIAQFALDITYCHITAPVEGRVGLRLVDPGNYITGSSSTGLAVITTMKPTTVEFTIAQNDLNKVVERFNTGAKLPVTAFTSDNSEKLGIGTLYALSNQMTVSTGTVTGRAAFPNENEALFPNEFVNVQLLVDTLTDAVLVPTPAVLTGAPGSYVYLVNQNHTVSVNKVTLGPGDGTNTAILKGLSAGDTVVTDGTDRLSDGARIKIATSAKSMAAATRTLGNPRGKVTDAPPADK